MNQKNLKLIVVVLILFVLLLAYRQNIIHTISFSFLPPESILENYTAYYYKYDEAFENMQRWEGLYIYGETFGSKESVNADVFSGELFSNCIFTNTCDFFCALGDIEEYGDPNIICTSVNVPCGSNKPLTKSLAIFRSDPNFNHCNGQIKILKFNPNILYHSWIYPPVKQKAEELTQGISNKWEKAQKIMDYVCFIPYPGELEEIPIYGWWVPTQIVTNKKTEADCKTKSTLLIALLRASGFSEKEVFFVTTDRHAYVVVKYNEKWLPVDPTNTCDFFYSVKNPQYDWNPILADGFGNDVFYYNNSSAFKEIIRKIRDWQSTPQ